MVKLTITYYYRGPIERGTGKPGYRWARGYSANSADGHALYPWLTWTECSADARAKGARAVFEEGEYGGRRS